MKDPTRFTVSYTGLCGGELENLEIETRLTDESFGCVSALKKKLVFVLQVKRRGF